MNYRLQNNIIIDEMPKDRLDISFDECKDQEI